MPLVKHAIKTFYTPQELIVYNLSFNQNNLHFLGIIFGGNACLYISCSIINFHIRKGLLALNLGGSNEGWQNPNDVESLLKTPISQGIKAKKGIRKDDTSTVLREFEFMRAENIGGYTHRKKIAQHFLYYIGCIPLEHYGILISGNEHSTCLLITKKNLGARGFELTNVITVDTRPVPFGGKNFIDQNLFSTALTDGTFVAVFNPEDKSANLVNHIISYSEYHPAMRFDKLYNLPMWGDIHKINQFLMDFVLARFPKEPISGLICDLIVPSEDITKIRELLREKTKQASTKFKSLKQKTWLTV